MAEIFFKGPSGLIEGQYRPQQKNSSGEPIVVILHPHPQHGGTMDNKVVFCLYKTFVNLGFNTLRFNFRGVGFSEGEYGQGEGELSDAAAALDWLQGINPNSSSCWVAGFSFGAWIGMQLLMRRPELERFVAISPPANMYDFSFLAPCPVSGLILQGDQDEIVPQPSVSQLAQRLSNQRGLEIDYKIIEGADHFYRGHLEELSQQVTSYVKKNEGTPSFYNLAANGSSL